MNTAEAPVFVADEIITGMCLWEAFLEITRRNANVEASSGETGERDIREIAQEFLDDEGSFNIRAALVDLVKPCDEGYKALMAEGGNRDDQFDWEWCPRFIETALRDGTFEAAIQRQYVRS